MLELLFKLAVGVGISTPIWRSQATGSTCQRRGHFCCCSAQHRKPGGIKTGKKRYECGAIWEFLVVEEAPAVARGKLQFPRSINPLRSRRQRAAAGGRTRGEFGARCPLHIGHFPSGFFGTLASLTECRVCYPALSVICWNNYSTL